MSPSESPTGYATLDDALALGPPEAGNPAVGVFRHGTLEVEFYQPGDADRQTPHQRDEVYVVARGTGSFYDGETTRPVAPGTFLFVPAGREHRFLAMSEEFAVWVMFYGPAGGETD